MWNVKEKEQNKEKEEEVSILSNQYSDRYVILIYAGDGDVMWLDVYI